MKDEPSEDIDRSSSEAARLLSSKRKIVTRTCEMCGKEFTGIRKRQYCSHACAQRAYARRKAGQTRQTGQVGRRAGKGEHDGEAQP